MLISAVIGSMAGSLPSTVLHFSFAGMFFLFAWISVDVVIISFIESRIATTAAIIVIMVATIVSRPFIILSSIIAIVSMSASFIPPCAGRGHTRSRRIGRMGARAGSTTPIISSPAPLPLFVSFVMFISASATAPLSFGISTPTLSFTTLPVSMAITIVPRRNVYHDSPPFLIFCISAAAASIIFCLFAIVGGGGGYHGPSKLVNVIALIIVLVMGGTAPFLLQLFTE
mmetsp:Transcript_3339/g.6113  ORF Transcript_3339/g.6113 Transcript_3339/m.6113 type:complete len:228 (-) Transcript_3339:316-999(-)